MIKKSQFMAKRRGAEPLEIPDLNELKSHLMAKPTTSKVAGHD